MAEDRSSRPSSSRLNAEISPDGRWLAYQSNRTGQFEIYVCSFPDVESLHQLSNAGGTHPAWARDGTELFYLDSAARLTVVSVRSDSRFEFGNPEVVLERSYYAPVSTSGRPYDVSPDGSRFLMIQESPDADDTVSAEIILVQNWAEELKRLVPTR